MSPSLVLTGVNHTSRVEADSPIPRPGDVSLTFDNTLGALFIGSSLATILYGIFCLQIFIYITSYRTRQDSYWTRLSISFIFVSTRGSIESRRIVDTVQQAMMTATMYKFLVSDFMNPFALASGGVASGEAFTFAQLIAGSCGVLLTQLFFSWRVWVISRTTFRMPLRVIISALTVILALFSCGYYTDLAVKGFNNSSLTVNTPDFNLAYTLAASSRVLFDLFITFAMTITLYRSRSGVKQMDHVITLVIVFIVNTNLLTTLLSISEVITFFTFPRATIYGGLGFLTPKLYCNALLASLNSRQFIRNELNPAGATVLSASEPTIYTGRPKPMGDSSASRVSMKGTVRDTMKRSVSDAEAQDSYEMSEQSVTKFPYLIPDI